MRILGVDPGSRLTGYGCIDMIGNQLRVVTHGTLKLSNTSGKATIALEERLLSIHQGLSAVIREFKPEILVIEKVFFAKNAVSALKLGQARGAAILTGMIHGLKISEYSPTEVKSAVAGHGAADKEQVAKMIQILVGKQVFSTPDASDGLALAICHAYTLGSAQTGSQASNRRLIMLSACRAPRRRSKKKNASHWLTHWESLRRAVEQARVVA